MLRLSQLDAAPPMQAPHGLSPEEATQRITPNRGVVVFGARFRMNAGRALLLPARQSQGGAHAHCGSSVSSRRPAGSGREFPSFPILVETYSDVLQDAFARRLRGRLRGIEEGRITIRAVQTEAPSRWQQSLQFGFVMA